MGVRLPGSCTFPGAAEGQWGWGLGLKLRLESPPSHHGLGGATWEGQARLSPEGNDKHSGGESHANTGTINGAQVPVERCAYVTYSESLQ